MPADATQDAGGWSSPAMPLRYVEAAGIQKPVSPHTLRHTFATHYLVSGGNAVALAEVLGHANLDTVMVYAHMAKLITKDGYRAKWLEKSARRQCHIGRQAT